MLTPTGFWSYSSSDDESSRGRLSRLRALLAAELQQQIGRAFRVNIFQDVAAIPPGSEWARQIKDAIEASSFVIPIITPAFLQSEWCCKEVETFRSREERLNASGLIFPIHYIDTEHVDGSDLNECHDRGIMDFLRARQWVDFRRLRLRNPEAEEVAIALENLARGIRNELRRPTLRPALSPSAGATTRGKSDEDPQASIAYPDPRNRWKRAEAGDAQAQFEVAEIHQERARNNSSGHLPDYPGGPSERESDHRQAATWYRKAADQGHAQAQLKLAECYEIGLGVGEDSREAAAWYRKAFAWYRKAAAQNDADAQYNLGERYATGRGVAKNEREAVAWYRKAAEQGYARGQNNLGVMLANGWGVGKDEHEAVCWYRKAAEQGYAVAQQNLGFMYENGRGVQKDEGEAVAWYRKAAEQGDAYAKERLAKLGAG
jgi:TPR repeat protein